jgi:hypothetical protein
MSQSAYISLVQGSAATDITLDDVKEHLLRYRAQTALTGKQLGWDYANAAFPYTIEHKPGEDRLWFYLKGLKPQYRFVLFGVGRKQEGDRSVPYIQVVLPEGATHGDKAKANEYCKWLGRQLLAEVKLFNGRIMHYNPRK